MCASAKIRLRLLPQERGRLVRVKHGLELAGGPPALQSIPVDWHDHAWRPRLVVRPDRNDECGRQNVEANLPGSFVRGAFPPFPFRLPHSRRVTFSNL
ncbi:MAG: hypothetical protein WBS33_06760 [Verrucomicrobiia bacterium]